MIEPAHLWIPPRLGSYGDEAIDLAAVAGRVLDDEQKLAVDAMLSYGAGGRYVALESAVIESRQNGKTAAVLLPVVLFDLFLRDDNPDRIVWTAHRFRTSRDAFDDFCTCIAAAPELSRRVKHISYSHGEEAIELHPKKLGEPAAKLEFLARSEGGGRGLGGKRVVLDEALILGPSTMGSLMPTLSARDDPQINYGSSGAKETSEHLHTLIKRGRRGNDPTLVWVEWCAPGSWTSPPCEQGEDCTHWAGVAEGCALDDPEMWQKANHTLGERITIAYVRGERGTLSFREFGRERLGWHEESLAESGVLSTVLWMSRIDLKSEAVGRVGIGVDASPDLASAAISLTGIREDGKRHWQVLKHDAGTGWVVKHLEQLRDVDKLEFGPIGIDPSSPAGALIKDITDAKFEVEETTGRKLVQAWGSFSKAVKEDDGRHMDQGTLNQAIKDARNAPSGDVEKFSRKKSSGDITPLVSVTLSDHALRMSPRGAPKPFALFGGG